MHNLLEYLNSDEKQKIMQMCKAVSIQYVDLRVNVDITKFISMLASSLAKFQENTEKLIKLS